MGRFAFAVVGLMLAACNGFSPGNQLEPLKSGVRLKGEHGYQDVLLGSIGSVSVDLFANPQSGATERKKTFTGSAIPYALRSIDFGNPRELGAPSAVILGQLTITYQDPGGSQEFRRFNILGSHIEDQLHPEVIYAARNQLDAAWLDALP